jgi:pectate lyase
MMVQTTFAALTITSTGADMSDSLLSAVRRHDTVILDGSKGEFIIGHTIVLKHLEHKTIIGTHEACLRTRFRISKDIRVMLDSADVMRLSTAGEGGVLSNGMKVREQRELKTRQLLIDRFNDPEETFRASGGIQLSHCRYMSISGLRLQGPGAIDVSGNDLIGMDHSTHIRIDSCVLMDGMDGNLDITSQSDSITISHCYFGYSELSYDHMNSNLIGAADRVVADRGKLHVTYAYCTWGEGCRQRMPMVRFGTILLDHCRWTCTTSHPVVDVRREATVIIDSPSFGSGVRIPYRTAPDAQCIIR